MSSYVFMRVLESAPHRYDLGMRLLSFGQIDHAYDALVRGVQSGQRVLDIGCGTGALTCRVARRGARVRGIDVNPEMLAIAHRRLTAEGLQGDVELVEAGVAELDREPASWYDVIVSGLCFSELSEDEITYTLIHIARILKAGGRLLVADEIRPRGLVLRVLSGIVRIPLVLLTYLLTQQTTHAVRDLPTLLTGARLHIVSHTSSALGTFGVFVAEKREEATP